MSDRIPRRPGEMPRDVYIKAVSTVARQALTEAERVDTRTADAGVLAFHLRALTLALARLVDVVDGVPAGPFTNDVPAPARAPFDTVTVTTRDHGQVTVPEPAWCLGDHSAQNGGYRTDIVHDGPETPLVFRGHGLLHAGLVAYPHAQIMPRGPFVSVELGVDPVSLDQAGLDDLAAGLIGHAGVLRGLGRQLAALTEGGAR